MTKQEIKAKVDGLHLSDIYSLMLFILYKVEENPDYAVLSELCFLLDGSNLNRLLTYFAGKTITIPSEEDFSVLTKALLLYQYVNIENNSLADAQARLQLTSAKLKDKVTKLYAQLIPVISQYNFDRGQIK